MSEYDRLKAQKNAMLKERQDAEQRLYDKCGRLRNLLRISLADLTGVKAGRLSPEELRVFLADCAAELDQPTPASLQASNAKLTRPAGTDLRAEQAPVAGSASSALLDGAK